MDSLFVTGGAPPVGKRRVARLPFLVCDSKLDKPVNDLKLILLWTRVRFPPSPPLKEIIMNLFHKLVRWGLGIHGSVHVIETVLNLYEQAYMSAAMSLFAGMLMISGACIDLSHHKHENSE